MQQHEMYRIFIIEDDAVIADSIRTHLEKWAYTVEIASQFQDITADVRRFDPHLIVLDIGLPYRNGFHWCKEIRAFSAVPILFLSSAADNMNIVLAMEMGGDDFIAKPFDFSVLTAKTAALLRRAYAFGSGRNDNILEHGGVGLNLGDMTLNHATNKVTLTKNETKLLQVLMEHRGQAVSRETMMLKLWESDNFIDDNTLTVNVTRLRKKLSDIGIDNYIITIKGMGYRLA